jgi:quinol-cytochrome oxidoreductase complex cytochrome b subunit
MLIICKPEFSSKTWSEFLLYSGFSKTLYNAAMTSSSKISASTDGFFKRIRASIWPDPLIPRTDAQRRRYLIRNLLLHFRPATVPQRTLALSLTWGLGGMAAVLVLVQILTGVMLKFVYEPTPVGAYASIQFLILDVPFGRLIRNMHHWSAHLLVLIILLHMLRVFFTGAFQSPRQFNWIIGLAMFGTVLAANFTGYLLPWDQLAYWAVTVSTGMLAYIPWAGPHLQKIFLRGTDIGPETLRVFFAVHTAVVPILLVCLMAFHFWRIRKAGGLVIPRRPGEAPVENPIRSPVLPDLLLREAAAAAVLIAVLMILSVSVNAPLADPANPGLSPNPTKAPWYFAGLQELLMHLHPMFAVGVVPPTLVAALLAVPYLRSDADTSGVWFASRSGRRAGIFAAATALVLTPVLILIGESFAGTVDLPANIPPIVKSGLIPFALLLIVVAAFYGIVKRRPSASRNDSIQAVFILLAVGFGVLTVVGAWFRGKGMAFAVPW